MNCSNVPRPFRFHSLKVVPVDLFSYSPFRAQMPPKRNEDEQQELTRIAVVNADRCKPKKCVQECKKACPVNKQGKQCIVVDHTDPIVKLSEELCIGCSLCVKRCPFGAIMIINIPSNLSRETTHRYGANSFKLHRLPLPRPGKVLGLVGPNGTGKSTALKILQGKLKPNLGRFRDEPTWEEIIRFFRGSEHQAYFQRILEDKVRAVTKIQYVDQVAKAVKGDVRALLTKQNEKGNMEHFIDALDLRKQLETPVEKLSGGELQRLTIAICCMQNAEVFMFDEPSSYLDVRQRLNAATVIRRQQTPDNYIICVEHDLAVLDYMSDFVCVLYGKPGAYGVVTMPFGVREGINIFLEGFVPTENLRFREEGLSFRMADDVEEPGKRMSHYGYPAMTKSFGKFTLNVEPGQFQDSEIIVLLGENGCGKTTLIRMLAGHMQPDNGAEVPQMSIAYKPQMLSPKFEGTVKDLLQTKINNALIHPQFLTDVIRPLKIEDLYDLDVQTLSGGEVQRVGITLCLGTPANIYLLDEPSAYLDSDQRIIASKVIKRFILHSKKTAFVVEHDFIMATYLADRVIVYTGEPAVNCTAQTPQQLLTGMNQFLSALQVTFRRDKTNYRPRINKSGSVKDREQKESGNYFYMMEPDEVVSAAEAGAAASADGSNAATKPKPKKGKPAAAAAAASDDDD